MGLCVRNPGFVQGYETESASTTDGLAVVVGSADLKVTMPGGADPVVGVVGLVMRPDGTAPSVGDTIDVVTTGIYPGVASAAISRGDKVCIAGTSGKLKTTAVVAGTNTMILGTALEAASGDGARFSVLLQISVFQG